MEEKTQEYWNERSVMLNEQLLNIGDDYYKRLSLEYDRAMGRIEKEIEAFYSRFAKENKITFSQSKRILTSSERKSFMMDIDEYIEKGKTLNYSTQWTKQLENASTAHRVTRLQSLQMQMRQQVEELYSKYNDGMADTATNIYSEGYYRSIYETQKGYGVGAPFSTLDTETVKKTIVKPWAPNGTNFSQKIWEDRESLVNYLNKELSQAFIRGEGSNRLIKEIQKKFNVSSKNAARLVQTEMAYFTSMSKLESYKALGYKKYLIVAVMDGKTSQICREFDNEVFDIEDFMPGATAPPFHPRCRTSVAPYAGAREGKAPGLMYDHDKKELYSVPFGMTYSEWYGKYVKGVADKPKDDKMELTDNEQRAINRYISSDSYILNEKLRDNIPLDTNELDFMNSLDSTFDKMPNYEGEAFRTMHLNGESLERFMNRYQQENVVTENAFLSFSKSDDYDDFANVRIKINSKKAKDISNINIAENEVIYKSGSSFYVKRRSVISNIIHVLLEER